MEFSIPAGDSLLSVQIRGGGGGFRFCGMFVAEEFRRDG
jgi:hypothetical protein